MFAGRRFYGLGIALAALALATGGCRGPEEEKNPGNGSAPSGETIKVGEYGSMTGSEATFGRSTDDGIQLAVQQINAAGGINGRQIEIVGPEDDQSQAALAETAVKRLLEKKPVAVLGEVASSASLAGGKVCQENEIPMISPSSTNPKVTLDTGDYVFRVCFIDPFQAAVVASFARKSLKADTAAIFYDSGQAYSVGFRDEFRKAFEKMGGRIVAEASYGKDDKDFKAPLTRLKSYNPQVILVPGYYTQAGAIVDQARDLGITVPILGGDGWDSQEFFKYAGTDVQNCYFSDHMAVDDPSPTVTTFVDAYRKKFSKEPDALAALGYDAAMLLFDAMKRAKSLNGPDLRDAIQQTKDFTGVTGTITINQDRNADKSAVILEVAGDKFKYKERIANP